MYNYVGGVGDEIDDLLVDVHEPSVPGDISSVLKQPIVKPKVTIAPMVSPGSPPLAKAGFPLLLVGGAVAAYFLLFR